MWAGDFTLFILLPLVFVVMHSAHVIHHLFAFFGAVQAIGATLWLAVVDFTLLNMSDQMRRMK